LGEDAKLNALTRQHIRILFSAPGHHLDVSQRNTLKIASQIVDDVRYVIFTHLFKVCLLINEKDNRFGIPSLSSYRLASLVTLASGSRERLMIDMKFSFSGKDVRDRPYNFSIMTDPIVYSV
jgi:hypothetical protein